MILIIWDGVVTPLMLCDKLKCISVITELWNKNTQKIWVCQHHFWQFFCFIEFRPSTADVFRDKAPAISYLCGHLSWVDIWELYERLKLICKTKRSLLYTTGWLLIQLCANYLPVRVPQVPKIKGSWQPSKYHNSTATTVDKEETRLHTIDGVLDTLIT